MAVSSNRSPSPVSARPNSSSRTPEFSNPIRRSFSGNPFNKPSIVPNPRSFNPTTPSNSPSDFGQRSSIDRSGGSFRDNEEKENEKEQSLKTGKIRSPAVLKGSKHFMSPTISAASKITAASPRKKVLTDRNEPLRTSSVSFSDGKSLPTSLNLADIMDDSDSKPEIGSNQKKKIDPLVDSKEMGLEAPLIPKAPKLEEASNSNETESSVSTVTDIDPNRVNGDLNARFMISPSPSPSCSTRPILAPLDADPSVPPPYDPKTNYLSPRPQFLHYRPNPRVGVYLNKESFIFESLSDTETTEETESEESLKEFEDDSSVEIVKEEEKEEEEKEPDVAESNLISIHSPAKTVEAEAKGVSKKHFWSRSKSISLLLILVVACLSISITDTPVSDGTHKLGALQFYNLTALQEDIFLDGYLMNDFSYEVGVAKYEQNELVQIRKVEVEISSLEEKGQTEIGADEDTVDVSLEEKGHTEIGADVDTADVSESQSAPEVEELEYPERETDNEIQEVVFEENEVPEDPETEEEVHLALETEVTEDKNSEAEEMFIEDESDNSLQSNAEVEEEPFLEVQPEVPEAKDIREHDNYLDSCAETESIKAEDTLDSSESIIVTHVISPSLEAQDFSVHRSEAEAILSVRIILGISLLALSLVAAAIFVYAKQSKSAIPNAAQELPAMKVISKAEWTHQARTPSLNWPTEVDMGSESCPSEMSSFQKCSSYSKRSGNHEARSLEKKIRKNSKRESSASSSSDFSMDSLSYGSFTTYELIHKKHGDEETATPVRRSSRIRSQVTSP